MNKSTVLIIVSVCLMAMSVANMKLRSENQILKEKIAALEKKP